MLKILAIPALNDNYIWLIINPENHHVVIVDPGDAAPVLKVIQEHHYIPEAILITHHHYDHTDGIAGILKKYSLPVFAGRQENVALASHPLDDSDVITLLEQTFTVIAIPGHTLGHIAYHTYNFIFTGDTLFTAGCGRIFEGTAMQMLNSLKKIANLSEGTLIYCGHEYTLANLMFAQTVEPDNVVIQKRIEEVRHLRKQNLPTVPASLALEKQTNPFLRTANSDVIKAVEHYAGTTLATEVLVFAALREWKNNFR